MLAATNWPPARHLLLLIIICYSPKILSLILLTDFKSVPLLLNKKQTGCHLYTSSYDLTGDIHLTISLFYNSF